MIDSLSGRKTAFVADPSAMQFNTHWTYSMAKPHIIKYRRGKKIEFVAEKPTLKEALKLVMDRYAWRICLHGRNAVRIIHNNRIIRDYPVVGQER